MATVSCRLGARIPRRAAPDPSTRAALVSEIFAASPTATLPPRSRSRCILRTEKALVPSAFSSATFDDRLAWPGPFLETLCSLLDGLYDYKKEFKDIFASDGNDWPLDSSRPRSSVRVLREGVGINGIAEKKSTRMPSRRSCGLAACCILSSLCRGALEIISLWGFARLGPADCSVWSSDAAFDHFQT